METVQAVGTARGVRVRAVVRAPEAEGGGDGAAAARRARFGHLPERVRFEDMVEEQVAPKDPARDAYAAAGSFISSSCLALDLGL